MSKKRPISDAERVKREQELYALYYENEDDLRIEQYSKYHFRLFKGDRIVDVWPVSKKYWMPSMNGSKIYQNVSEVIKDL